jgi:hypothetical protein
MNIIKALRGLFAPKRLCSVVQQGNTFRVFLPTGGAIGTAHLTWGGAALMAKNLGYKVRP